MVWNIAPETTAVIVLSIIWIYSRKGNITPSLKNKLFQLCFLITFLATFTNIISTLLIYHLTWYTIVPAWIFNTIYFITTPLMGFIYYLYVLANIYDRTKIPKRILIPTMIPAILYILLILINPWTHWVYHLNVEFGYAKGSFISSTYIIFYFYCVCCVFLVLWNGKTLGKTVRNILFSFPVIAGLVIIVQLIYPDIILSGSAATIALLLIYLYMQNRQISVDHLTNLPNRHEFVSIIKLRTETENQKPFAIIVVSLREFKRINDVYGQYAGDCFLVAVSTYLKQTFSLNERQLFRYSGDEFALIIPYVDRHEIDDTVAIIKERMSKPWVVEKCTCQLYVAQGVVEYPDCVGNVEQTINGIEFSIHLAKDSSSTDHVCYCTKEILEKVHRRQQIAELLQYNLSKHNFEIYYQPIYDIATGKFVNAEALLRVPSSALDPLYPDEFIPVAEETGMIIDISYMVLDEVCHILQHIKQEGLDIDCINVNFSASQFLQPDLMEKVIAILKEHEIDGSMIKIEITESTLSENATVMLEYVNKMHSYGIKLALDDFGTGYSNTATVLTFPIDTIKLDKSMIWAAMKNDRSKKIVENLSHSFKDLGYTVLAEGVETQEQADFVENCGCSYIQGYLYAKPMPKDAYIAFLKEHR